MNNVEKVRITIFNYTSSIEEEWVTAPSDGYLLKESIRDDYDYVWDYYYEYPSRNIGCLMSEMEYVATQRVFRSNGV